jgi:glycosyltransferase involved in cell wall biosynthesis
MASRDPNRIALFFSSLRGGGIERARLNLAEGLLARGVNVDLVVVDARGDLEALVPGEASLFDLKCRRTLLALPRMVEYLRTRRPAAVLASQTHVNFVAISARAMARIPTRLVVSEHVAMDAVARNAGRKERWFPLGARLLYRKADVVVVVSHATADRLAAATGLPRSMARVIYNPVVTPDLLAQAEIDLDHPWFTRDGPPVILSAGRLTRQKDHKTLVRAFALLRRTTDARLVILGEGQERRNIENLVADLGLERVVQLPGFVLNPFAYMARARLFVLSSRWEGFGNVLVEAMACGVPVVSTDCPSGPAEILQNGDFGRLTPVGDAAALADAMLRTLQRPPDADVLRARGRVFSRDRAVDQYLEALLP